MTLLLAIKLHPRGLFVLEFSNLASVHLNKNRDNWPATTQIAPRLHPFDFILPMICPSILSMPTGEREIQSGQFRVSIEQLPRSLSTLL